ncbi:hypothetical protein [Rufibacter psychrotolerans]|uniref:hypothetical protein n=1 Tax=Rufibacter psychrotolerans TaxID=2812556 RepID=UPI0019672D58|nr:hypothetical protein [Rufibacter sp. SYSU D00308]
MKRHTLLQLLALTVLLLGTGLQIFHVIDRPVFYVFVGIGFVLSMVARTLRNRSLHQK